VTGNSWTLATALADRYKIDRELGQGGMATVYLAEDLKHRRKVAVKVLNPDLAAAPALNACCAKSRQPVEVR
jgi:serine/threonine protein kinase